MGRLKSYYEYRDSACLERRKMETNKRLRLARRIIGDVLIAAAVLLTVDVVIVMVGKINSIVLKDGYYSAGLTACEPVAS